MMGVLNLLSALILLSLLPPGLSHVVDRFSSVPQCEEFFQGGETPNIPGVLVDGKVQDQNRYKPICQFFNNVYRFATLYDTTNRIPVFSAYKFTGSATGRPDPPWMMEPQLNNIGDNSLMRVSGNDLYHHQARNMDYTNSIPNKGVNRGHLFPSSHAPDDVTKRSTFTLTNIVPQAVTFNNGSWSNMEEKVKDILQYQCVDNNHRINGYVVTGALPSESNTLNNRVNIPSVMWTAFCCYKQETNEWLSEAHWGQNIAHARTYCSPVAELEKLLTNFYNGAVNVFPRQCILRPESIWQRILNYFRHIGRIFG